MDFSNFEPPSGVSFSWTENSLKIELQFNILIKLAILLFWILVTVFVAILFFNPGAFKFKADDINWSIFGPIWGFLTFLAVNFLMLKTVIKATPEYLKIIHLPWHFPFSKKVATSRVNGIEIETEVFDEHSNRPAYRFNVQLSLSDDHWKPVIFSSQDQEQSVFIKEILKEYLSY